MEQRNIINLLDDITQDTNLPICRILSLALDVPDLFDYSDKYLYTKLTDYVDTLQFNERMYEDDEEEDTY